MTLQAQDTLSVAEIDPGETLSFRLRSGRTVSLRLLSVSASVLERVPGCSADYLFRARLEIDGQCADFLRYVGSQGCFYEPFVVDGLRLWLDTAAAVFDAVPVRGPAPGALRCVPRKALRIALQDAALRICPDRLHPWMQTPRDAFDVADCYGGDDCYLGPYRGDACHVGMDMNAELGSPLFAPLRLDGHGYFQSLAGGGDNNRWRGIRRWPNGDVWALQTHHMVSLDAPAGAPVEAGTAYGTAAGVAVGAHFHTHFEFKVARPVRPGAPVDFSSRAEPPPPDAPAIYHLDPWILFWQIFEDSRERKCALHVSQAPVAPGRAGEAVAISADIRNALAPVCFWTFGDGASAMGASVSHAFARPGVYAVTATVSDGAAGRVCATQHVVVTGDPSPAPCPALRLDEDSPDFLSFRPRRPGSADLYGAAPPLPHTLRFVVRPDGSGASPRILRLVNLADGPLPRPRVELDIPGLETWLSAQVSEDAGGWRITVAPIAVVPHDWPGIGRRSATVRVVVPGAEAQCFRVVEDLRPAPEPRPSTVVDDFDPGFQATPWFWTAGRGVDQRTKGRGFGGRYFTNGCRAAPGEFARFTPDLAAGRYEVRLRPETPFDPGTEFSLRIRHRDGVSLVRIRPDESLSAGRFDFSEGSGEFVDILAENSVGLVLADAVEFRLCPHSRS